MCSYESSKANEPNPKDFGLSEQNLQDYQLWKSQQEKKQGGDASIGFKILFGLFFGSIGAFVCGFLLHLVVFNFIDTDIPIAFIISGTAAIILFIKSISPEIDNYEISKEIIQAHSDYQLALHKFKQKEPYR